MDQQPWTVGLSTAALYPHTTTEDGLRVAAELGFDVVELFLQTVGEYHPRFLGELQTRCADLGVHVYAIHVHSRHYGFWAAYRRQRDEAAALARAVTYVETAIDPRFQDEFVGAIHIPHASDHFPHLESRLGAPLPRAAAGDEDAGRARRAARIRNRAGDAHR